MARLPLLPLVVCLLVVATTGCQPTVRSRLEGKWEGRPDTTAAIAARQAKASQRKATSNDQAADESDSPSEEEAEAAHGPTDLERFDVAIELEFQSGGTARMTLVGGESYDAVWRVLTKVPPDGAEIELGRLGNAADAPTGSPPTKAGDDTVVEKRRFVIDFQKDGDTEGFTLREKGADPKFGRLYFTRAGSPRTNAPPVATSASSNRSTTSPPASTGVSADDRS